MSKDEVEESHVVNEDVKSSTMVKYESSQTDQEPVRYVKTRSVSFDVQPKIYIYQPTESDSDSPRENDENIDERGTECDGDDDDDDEDDDDDGDGHRRSNISRTMVDIDSTDKLKQLQKRKDSERIKDDEINKRNAYNNETELIEDIIDLKERWKVYNEEKIDIEEREEALKEKKVKVSEQEKELKEYEAYLERRHTSLNKKEEDLCILQDQLEELSDILKDKKDVVAREESLLPAKQCTHDEAEIEETRMLLNNSLRIENELNEKLEKKEKEIHEKNATVSDLENENEKLRHKVKHLELNLTSNISSIYSSSLSDRQTNFTSIVSSIPHQGSQSLRRGSSELVSPQKVPSRQGSVRSALSVRLSSPQPVLPENNSTGRTNDKDDKLSPDTDPELPNVNSSDEEIVNPVVNEEVAAHDTPRNNITRRLPGSGAISKTCIVM